MKKLYALILSLASLTVYGQQQAGDLSIQFSGNYTSSSVQYREFGSNAKLVKIKSFAGNIYVKVGKYFTNNIELGLKPNVFFMPKEKKVGEEIKYSVKTTIGLGLYGTYSFLTADAKWMPYGGAEVNYLPIGDEATLNLGPYAGCKYFLTEKINVDANLNYLITLASSYGNLVRDLKFSPTLQFNIGIGVIISGSDQ